MNSIGTFILRSAGSMLSPSGAGGRLSVLIYHRVLNEADPLFPDVVDAGRFESQMIILKNLFNVLPLSEAVDRLKKGNLPSRAACVTFDDGYADNFKVALPILRRQNIPATFFVSTGYLDGGIMFNDKVIETIRRLEWDRLDLSESGLGVHLLGSRAERLQAVSNLLSGLKYKPMDERHRIMDEIADKAGLQFPGDIMMTANEVRGLHDAGMEIGGHTVNHPILSKLDDKDARAEIADGAARLSEITGRQIRLFAYPNGIPGVDYLSGHVRMIEELGFDAAFTTAKGVAKRGSDYYQLPRFTPWDIGLSRFSLRLAGNLLQTEVVKV